VAKSDLVLHDLADLARYFPIDDPPDDPAEEATPLPCSAVAAMTGSEGTADAPPDFQELLAQLAAASATLTDLAQQTGDAH
jgi:hypothetical protein